VTDRLGYADAFIASGTSLSTECDLRNHNLMGIEMPAAWDAAGIAFQACMRNDQSAGSPETFLNVVDQAGTAIAVTVAASQFILFTAATLEQLRGLARTKVRSGTNAAPVNQTANRTVRLIVDNRR
jgi:hypothetical protein